MDTNEFKLGAHSYSPEFYYNTKEFLLGNNVLLNNIRGAVAHSLMIVWSTEHEEAWLDAPVVLVTDYGQIELCAFKLHEFSITLNTIKTNISPKWSGDERFEWRQFIEYPKDEFIIEDIGIIENMHSIDNNDYFDLGGIQFRGGKSLLSIHNGLDCNIINTSEIDQSKCRLIKL